MNSKPAKQKQPNIFSENWAVIPPKKDIGQHRDLSQYTEFNTSRISKRALKDYLEFCSKIFPNGENSLGIVFNDDIKESRALNFLASQNYDIVKAKFYLAFPVLYRSIKVHKLNVEISEQEMKNMLEEFKRQKNPAAVSKQMGFFEPLLQIIESRREKISIQEVKDILNEASKLKYDIPIPIKQEFSKACDLGDKINDVLQKGYRRISEMDMLLEAADKIVMLPESLEKLRSLRAKIEELVYRSAEFMNNIPKDVKVATQILGDLRHMNLEIEQVPHFIAVKKFNETLQEMLNLYRVIKRPMRGTMKQSEKISFMKYYSLIEFLIVNQVIEQEKIDELVEYVNEKIKMKETCQMYLEDDRNTNYSAFIPVVTDLTECTLDFIRICSRVNDKIEALRTLESLALNIDNEKDLFKNLELLKAYRKRGCKLYRNEILYFEKILHTLSRIDDIVVEMNTVELTMEQFLFEDVKLPNYNELKGLLELDFMRGRKNNNYLQNMKNFLDSYTEKLDEYYHRQDWNIQQLYEGVQELVAYILQDDVKLPFLKNKLLRSLLVEFELVRFLDKFTNTRFNCTYSYWNTRMIESARVFNDIKTGFDYFIGNELVRPYTKISVHYSNLLIIYEQYKSVTNFVQDANLDNMSPENVEQLEEMLTGIVNDPVHTHMLDNAKQINNIRTLLASFEQHKSSKYIEHDDLLQNILIISPDSQKSKEFLKKNFCQFTEIYRESQSFNICIDEKDIQDISLFFKKKGIADQDKFSIYKHSIEQIKDIIETNHRIFKDYQRFTNKDEESFILKLPLFVVILFKLSSLGIETSYCAEIRVFIKYYLELMDFMELKNKKSLKEMIDISAKLSDLKVYLPVFNRFKALLPFARVFVEDVSVMETIFRSNMVTSCEVAHNMLKKVKAKDYSVNVTKSGLYLKKRSSMLFENSDFKEQMQSNGKRVKKLKNPETLLSDNKMIKPLNKPPLKILPIVFNQTEQEYCLCREKYEIIGSTMLKYNKCDEWFHKECIKLPKYRMEKVNDDYCIACDFLESRLNNKLESFIQSKVEENKYMEIFKSYMYLKTYLLDEKIDFIDYVHKKMKRMTEGLDLLINEIENLNEKPRKSRVHNLALLYLYLPVRIENIEKILVDLYNINN